MTVRAQSGGRRLLVATAVAHYAKRPEWNRPGLVDARQQIIDLFTRSLGYTHLPDLGLDPTKAQLTQYLRSLCRYKINAEDHLVVYLAGHGEILDPGGHVLLTNDTDPDDIHDALPTAALARTMLLDTSVQRLLLLLDTCYSGEGGHEFAASALAGMRRDRTPIDRPGLVVVTSTQPLEQADTGAFPILLKEAVHGLPTVGYVPKALALEAVVQAMNDSPQRPGHQLIGWTASELTGHLPDFFLNPRHRSGLTDIDLHVQQVSEWEADAEGRELEFRRHLLLRAMGGGDDKHPAWWFTGRHIALTEITRWLTTPEPHRRALVVTGGLGSGKTAVLGLVSALTHPEHRRIVPQDAIGLPPAAVPSVGLVDVTIYAGGLTHDKVISGLAAAAQVHANTIGELLEALSTSARQRPFTAIIDAVDEAKDPHRLIAKVLRPILENGHARLLLGTRPHLIKQFGPVGTTPLPPSVGVLNLDEPTYADIGALTAYTIRGLLEGSLTSPYQGQSPSLIRAVAEAVAHAAAPSFLVARFNSTRLAATDLVTNPADPEWRASLPRLPGDAIREDMKIRLTGNADRGRDLLRPLAYAEGQGIPWENVWAPLASRISGRTYTDADLLWLREHAGSYVVEATEDGRSVYRLYHQALTEHFRDDAHSAGIADSDVHSAFVDVLASIPRTADAARDWTRAHPYALRHLATHAAAAGRIDELLTDADYLVHAHPDALLAALEYADTPDGILAATVYRTSIDHHKTTNLTTRRQLLSIDAARAGQEQLRDDLCREQPMRPIWATGSLVSSARRAGFTGHTQSVKAVACGHVDGALVAVTSAIDFEFGPPATGEMLVWDVKTGQRRFALRGHKGGVSAIACTEFDSKSVAISVGDSSEFGRAHGEAFVWNLSTGRRQASLKSRTRSMKVVACIDVGGAPVAVIGASITRPTGIGFAQNTVGELLVWDLRSGEIRAKLTGHSGHITAVSCTHVDGVPLVVSASSGEAGLHPGEIFVSDLRTGERWATLTGHPGLVGGIACMQIEDAPIVVASCCHDLFGTAGGKLMTWNLRAAHEAPLVIGSTMGAAEVACSYVDGIPIAITASGFDDESNEGELLVWDLHASALRNVLQGHTGSVNAVTCAELDGNPVAVSAGASVEGRFESGAGEAMVWNLRAVDQPAVHGGHARTVSAAACIEIDGRPVALTGADTEDIDAPDVGEVIVWDLPTGRRRTTLTGHLGPVKAIACTDIGGTPVALTAALDPIPPLGVSVWDLRAGARRGVLEGHAWSPYAVACGKVEGGPIAVTVAQSSDPFDVGEIFVWDLQTLTRRAVIQGHRYSVIAVACTEVDGIPIAITAGGYDSGDCELLMWDLRTGMRHAVLKRATPVSAITCTQIAGMPVAVAGGVSDNGARGDVTVWDLRAKKQLLRMNDHLGPVRAIVCGESAGLPLAVSIGGGITVWNLTDAEKLCSIALPGTAHALALQRNTIITSVDCDVIALDLRLRHR
jgi:WD40 repeat protein